MTVRFDAICEACKQLRPRCTEAVLFDPQHPVQARGITLCKDCRTQRRGEYRLILRPRKE